MRFYLESYGCSASRRDAELIAWILEKRGWKEAKRPEDAEMLVINTCVVKKPTEEKMVKRIKRLAGLGKRLIIAGCMPEVMPEVLQEIAPDASWVSTNRLPEFEMALEKKVRIRGRKLEKAGMQKKRKNPVIDIIEIGSGCNHRCSYCIVKLVKGDFLPYPKEKILAELKAGLEAGCKEFWITSQDLASHPELPRLLLEMLRLPGKHFFRLGMMHPGNLLRFLPEMLEVYQDPKVFKFLHLPLQSGSDRILTEMGRGYKAGDFLRIVKKFRETFPRLTLWTDVIIGYPGEEDDDFEQTLRVLEKIRPDWVNVSKFGKRPGTRAEKLKELPRELVEKRTKEAAGLVRKLAEEANLKWTGWQGEVLIDEWNQKKKSWIGRNFAYKPVALSEGRFGEFLKVEISGYLPTCLLGRVIKKK